MLTPAQILERLSQRLDLLKGGRDADPRQQTLRATIEWSYDLLSEEEQRVFRALSVFAGGCTLEAAEEVADADLDTLQSLVEKSLLRFTSERFWMLETIREYALGELVRNGEAEPPLGSATPSSSSIWPRSCWLPLDDRPPMNNASASWPIRRTSGKHTRGCGGRRRGERCPLRSPPWSRDEPGGLAARGLVGKSACEPRPAWSDGRGSCVRACPGGQLRGMSGEFDPHEQLLPRRNRLFEDLGEQRGLADAVAWRSKAEIKAGNLSTR